MKKPSLIFLSVLFFCFFAGCANGYKNAKETSIRFENATGKEIVLLSFSDKITNETPVVLQPHKHKDLHADSKGSGIDIVFSYNENRYAINTGYADDYASYTLRVSESNSSANGIECFFITKGFTGTEKKPREINPVIE